MDGLSSAASGIAVISLAAQLGKGLIDLYGFWGSIRDAPQEVADVLTDLKILSNILNELILRQDYGSHVVDALKHCELKVEARLLFGIVRELEPKFESKRLSVRLWSGFKAARKKQKMKHFRESLRETKITLLLALIPQFQIPDLPSKYDSIDTSMQPTPISPLTDRTDWRKLSKSDGPVSSLEESFKSAMQVAAESYFQSGAFTKAMRDTIQRVAAIKTTFRREVDAMDAIQDDDPAFEDTEDSFTALVKSGRRDSQSRLCYRTSATGVLFGTVWLRTTSARFDSSISKHGRKGDFASSISFMPSSWLRRAGVNYGMEANFSSTTTGWRFNFNPIRVVPDNSPIFTACKQGNLATVQFLLADGKASVWDTNSKGMTPLHFAALAESETNIDVCEFLTSQGADKTALAFDGPTSNSLSPIAMFSATSKRIPAERKINMLRFFEDCIDLSEPDSEGWVILGDLVSAFDQEGSSVIGNSIMWFLTAMNADSMVGFGPKALWHGVQHAVRSFINLANRDRVVQDRLDVIVGGKFPEPCASAIAHWMALITAGKKLLPLILEGGSIWHMEGFDYDPDSEVDPVALAKQRPWIYTTWSKTLKSNLENAHKIFASELAATLEIYNWSQAVLQDLKASKLKGNASENHAWRCLSCQDDYSSMKFGLVEPSHIAFVECVKFQHRYNCACEEYIRIRDQSREPTNILINLTAEDLAHDEDIFQDAKSQYESDDESDTGGHLLWHLECERYIAQAEHEDVKDPFRDAASLLYRAQARLWLGDYQPGQRLCGSCFLWSEGYMDEDVQNNGDFWPSVPKSFRNSE